MKFLEGWGVAWSIELNLMAVQIMTWIWSFWI